MRVVSIWIIPSTTWRYRQVVEGYIFYFPLNGILWIEWRTSTGMFKMHRSYLQQAYRHNLLTTTCKTHPPPALLILVMHHFFSPVIHHRRERLGRPRWALVCHWLWSDHNINLIRKRLLSKHQNQAQVKVSVLRDFTSSLSTLATSYEIDILLDASCKYC